MVKYITIPQGSYLLPATDGDCDVRRVEGMGITMLALLSAPRGRVSAARVAARAREREQAEAQRMVTRLPVERMAAVTPECEACEIPAVDGHGWPERAGRR